ncbi:hypothetical protein ACFL35_13235 [Candidatus Riflebacteria bacterium]
MSLKLIKKDFSLMEIMVMLAILALVTIPIMDAFSTSIKMGKVSARLYKSINFASSYMEAIRAVDVKKLKPFAKTLSTTAPSPFDLKSQGFFPDESFYTTYIKIKKCKTEDIFNVFKIVIELVPKKKKEHKIYRLCSIMVVKNS